MITFPVLRTRRLKIEMAEQSIAQAIAVAKYPVSSGEAARTQFLRNVVRSVQCEEETGLGDPQNWTVEERTLAVCHYIAYTADDGPDFPVGDLGHYSDYLDGAADYPVEESVSLTMPDGTPWLMVPMTGGMAEAIERLKGEVHDLHGRAHWLLGGMAAQMSRDGEDRLPIGDDTGAFDELILDRMKRMADMAEGDFIALSIQYRIGRDSLRHLFRPDFSDNGIVFLPNDGGAGLTPAQFPPHAAITSFSKSMGGAL